MKRRAFLRGCAAVPVAFFTAKLGIRRTNEPAPLFGSHSVSRAFYGEKIHLGETWVMKPGDAFTGCEITVEPGVTPAFYIPDDVGGWHFSKNSIRIPGMGVGIQVGAAS